MRLGWQVGGGRMFVNSFSLSVGWECGLTILARGVLAGLEVSILRLRSYLDRDHHCSNTALPLINLVIHNYSSLQRNLQPNLSWIFVFLTLHHVEIRFVKNVLKLSILWLRSYSDRDHHCSNTALPLMNLGISSWWWWLMMPLQTVNAMLQLWGVVLYILQFFGGRKVPRCWGGIPSLPPRGNLINI